MIKTLVEGNNELNIEMTPLGVAEFVYVSGIRQVQSETAPGQPWSRYKLRAIIDVKNVGSVAAVCQCNPQIACAEGGWAWTDFAEPGVVEATLQPGEIVSFWSVSLDSPKYGYTCQVRFVGDPGITDPVVML